MTDQNEQEKARELVKPFCTEMDDHTYPQEECGKHYKCADIATAVAVALREAKAQEAELSERTAMEHKEASDQLAHAAKGDAQSVAIHKAGAFAEMLLANKFRCRAAALRSEKGGAGGRNG